MEAIYYLALLAWSTVFAYFVIKVINSKKDKAVPKIVLPNLNEDILYRFDRIVQPDPVNHTEKASITQEKDGIVKELVNKLEKVPYIFPLDFNLDGENCNVPYKSVNLCNGSVLYPFNNLIPDYGIEGVIPDNCACTKYIQAP